MLCVWSEAPDVKTLDITDEINRHISASIIRYRFTQNTQECLICPNSSGCMLDCNIVIQIAPFASFFCVSSPPLKVGGFFGFLFWHPTQTPPPLRSTDTGSLWSRVSSAVFIRMARRLSDTCPFFTALISCGGNRREQSTWRVGQRRERLTCQSEAGRFPRAEIIICRTRRKPPAWQWKALELTSLSLRGRRWNHF